ncbi:MAG: hypothetical protein WBR24_05535 [Desulfobacterales bacterium]
MAELFDILPAELGSGKGSVNCMAGIGALFALISHFYDAIDPEFWQHCGGAGGKMDVICQLRHLIGQAFEPVKNKVTPH